MKGAAYTGLALHPNTPLHQLHQTGANAQARTGAAVVAGGGFVRLAEGQKIPEYAEI